MKKKTDRKRCDCCGGKFNSKGDMFKVGLHVYCENCFDNYQGYIKGD